MSADQNKKNIEQLFTECIAQRNYALLDQFIHPSYVNYSFPAPETGPDGMRLVIENFYKAFPDMKITMEQIIGEGDVVATRGYWTGTNNGEFMGMKPTGKRVKVGYIDFWKMRDGKGAENWVQMDIAGLMQQLQETTEQAAKHAEA